MKKAALYGRTSDLEKGEGYSIESQLRALRELAIKKGYAIPDGAVFIDDGVSGRLYDRPAFDQLKKLAKEHAFNAVFIHDPDRLSRNLLNQLRLIDELKNTGVHLEFVTTPNIDTPEGRMLMQMKGMVSEYELERILERTMRGKREKAHEGYIPAGSIPYGYRPDPNGPRKVIICEDEAAVIRMIYRWLVDERRSIRSITAELRALGIKSPQSGAWARSSVRRVLTEKTYMGTAHYNRRMRCNKHIHCKKHITLRSQSDWITIPVPPIVTQELFERVQTQLDRNKQTMSGRPGARFYLLKSLMHCGSCKKKLHGVPVHGRRFYRCAGRDRFSDINDRCRAPISSADRIEGLVWSAIVDVLRSPQLLYQKLATCHVELGKRTIEVQSESDRLAQQLKKIEKQRDKLLDLYLDDETGKLDTTEAKKRLLDYQHQHTHLTACLAEAKKKLDHYASETATENAIRQYCAAARRGLDQLTPEGRRQLLLALIDRIVLRDGNIQIHGILPAHPTNDNSVRNWSEHPLHRAAWLRQDDARQATCYHPA